MPLHVSKPDLDDDAAITNAVPELEVIEVLPVTVIVEVPAPDDAEFARVRVPVPEILRLPATLMVGVMVPVVATRSPPEILRSRPIERVRLPVEATRPKLKELVLRIFKSRPTLVRAPPRFRAAD